MSDPPGDAPRDPADQPANGASSESTKTLAERVEKKYDFDNFTPADMVEMTVDEWEAVFDPDTWITGPELLDRVEADLKTQVANRELFAVIERFDDRVLAYTDTSYAVVHADGTVEGEGPIRGDVEPTVVLCSMDDYEVPTPPDGELLPHPDSVAEGSGDLGNRLLQAVAGVLLIAGLALLLAAIVTDLPGTGSTVLIIVVGLGFLLIGVILLVLVANARLSDRFRAEEYRDRLRAAGVGSDERPAFLPVEDEEKP